MEVNETMKKEKKMMGVVISKEVYRKIHVINMVKKYFLSDKDYTISSMVEDAIKEYFVNHNNDIQKMMDEYHEKGGCGDL